MSLFTKEKTRTLTKYIPEAFIKLWLPLFAPTPSWKFVPPHNRTKGKDFLPRFWITRMSLCIGVTPLMTILRTRPLIGFKSGSWMGWGLFLCILLIGRKYSNG